MLASSFNHVARNNTHQIDACFFTEAMVEVYVKEWIPELLLKLGLITPARIDQVLSAPIAVHHIPSQLPTHNHEIFLIIFQFKQVTKLKLWLKGQQTHLYSACQYKLVHFGMKKTLIYSKIKFQVFCNLVRCEDRITIHIRHNLKGGTYLPWMSFGTVEKGSRRVRCKAVVQLFINVL